MSSLSRRARRVIVSSFLIALASPLSATAAAPRVIMFYGGFLSEPIILADWSENMLFMGGADRPITVPDQSTTQLPSIEVAFFWGPEVARYADEGKPLDRLDPNDAPQHGKYYPPQREGEMGIIVMDRLPDFLANRAMTRQIDLESMEILRRHNVPITATLPRRKKS
jgi:hypothetical protein